MPASRRWFAAVFITTPHGRASDADGNSLRQDNEINARVRSQIIPDRSFDFVEYEASEIVSLLVATAESGHRIERTFLT